MNIHCHAETDSRASAYLARYYSPRADFDLSLHADNFDIIRRWM